MVSTYQSYLLIHKNLSYIYWLISINQLSDTNLAISVAVSKEARRQIDRYIDQINSKDSESNWRFNYEKLINEILK